MKTYILASALGFALLLPQVSQADNQSAPRPPGLATHGPQQTPKPKSSATITPQVDNAFVITCYTCGGYYPYHVASGNLSGTGNLTYEWGSACSGGQEWRADNTPFLCATHP
jgi:hypothetical protein